MGKTYKKKIRAERAKVKLKKAKDALLPKGQNLTDTNFKVKKVVIRDQTKVHDSGDVLFRNKLNLKELISRLKHHNVSIKTDALEGIRQLITILPNEKLELDLTTLVEAVVKLILSETKELRKTSNKLLSNIFHKMGVNDRKTLYHMINSYLICGLTHIDRNIREDSLHFMDTCLKYGQELCSDYAYELIFICLDLVSEKSESSRTLTLNLDAKKGSKLWRIQVLQRIFNLLSALLRFHKDFNQSNEAFEAKVLINEKMESDGMYFPIFTPLDRNYRSPVFGNSFIPINTQNSHSTDKLVHAVFPLLLQMSVEVFPPSDTSKLEMSRRIDDEDASFLRIVSQIIEMIWTMCERNDPCFSLHDLLINQYGQNIISNLIEGKFPYSTNKPNENENEMISFSPNLPLCKLVFLFGSTEDWKLVIPYLKNLMETCDKMPQNDLVVLSSCIEKICRTKTEEMKYFLPKIVDITGQKNHVMSSYCFKILSNLVLDSNLAFVHKNKELKRWLNLLPKKLLKKKITSFQVETICKIAARKFQSFNDSLNIHIESILDNLTKLEIVGQNDYNLYERIASLLLWVEDWDEEISSELKKGTENNYWGDSLTGYIKDIIWLKDREIIL